MCGRYTQSTPAHVLADRFEVDEVVVDDVAPSWNVAPTDRVYAVAEHRGQRLLGAFAWGLVPPWAEARRAASRINARAETLDTKPAFRDSFARRRCLVPADGFYEWRTGDDGRKHPYLIRRRDGDLLAFAGLFAVKDGLRTCTIVTTHAGGDVAALHDRMPVILPPDTWAEWLDREQHDTAVLRHLLEPLPDGLLEVVAVGPAVNSVRNNGPELVRPVAEA